jgi:hypothetical protein
MRLQDFGPNGAKHQFQSRRAKRSLRYKSHRDEAQWFDGVLHVI